MPLHARVRAAGVALASIFMIGGSATSAAAITTTTTSSAHVHAPTTAPRTAPTTARPTTAAPSRAPAAAGASVTVEIRSGSCPSTIYCFSPEAVTISSGGTVRWVDVSHSPHTATRCDPAACLGTGGGSGTGGAFRGDIATDGEFSHTFSGTGSYNYYCEIHGFGDMHGSITVLAAVTTTTAAPGSPATAPPSGAGPTTPAAGNQTAGATVTTDPGPHLAGTGSTGRLLVAGWALTGVGALLAATRRPRRKREP